MSRRLDHIHALVSSWEAATASPYPKSHFPGVASTDSTLSVAVERLIEPFCSLQFLRRIHPWAHFPISIGRWAPTSSLGCCSPAVAAAAHNKRALLGPLRLWLIANLGPCNAHVHPPCSRASWWLDERSDWTPKEAVGPNTCAIKPQHATTTIPGFPARGKNIFLTDN